MLMMALVAVIVPAVGAAVVIGLGRAIGGRGGACLAASAVGIAYIAGHVGVARPAFPPGEFMDYNPWLALAAAVLAVFEAARPPGPVARTLGRTVLAALTLGLVLGPVVSASGTSRYLVISGLVALAAWVNLEALAANPRGPDVVRGVLIAAAGAGLVLMLSGSAVLGFLGVALAAALAGAWLAGWGRPPEGHVPVAAAVLTALVLEGYVYASVPVTSALLLAAAPAATWVARLGPARRLGPWASAALGTIAVLIPVAVAIGLAVASAEPSEY